ncbi:MAG: FAD-dependent oxidoreductase [Thainema sp.]
MPGPAIHQNGIFASHVFTRPSANQTLTCPILIVGGSTAAYSAALTGLKYSQLEIYLVQPRHIVGGQFTTQGLPASDDGSLIQQAATGETVVGERFALSQSQRQFRQRQRQLQPLQGEVVSNPGGGWVSPLCTTPIVAATALNDAIAPFLNQNRLKLVPHAVPIQVLKTNSAVRDRMTGVVFRDTQRNYTFTISATVIIEATDLGDLLELGNIPSHVGQESRQQTNEQILPMVPHPECQQSFTYGVAVERVAGRSQVMPAPNTDYGRDPFTTTYYKKSGGEWKLLDFYHDFGPFRYRRMLRQQPAEKKISDGDITVLNWGVTHDPAGNLYCGNDYRPGYLVGVDAATRQRYLREGYSRARAYVRYLQTNGLAELQPRGDVMWSSDGVALDPYIREARRGQALTTIRHEDVAEAFFPNAARGTCFDDSVGIGDYHYIDLHGNDARGHVAPLGAFLLAKPFSLPLGALVPRQTDGLILSSKSIGTTHLTNAVYRLHPIEWAIGEASGFLAVFTIWTGLQPREIAQSRAMVRKLQGFLTRNGIPIFWFDDVAHDDPDFEPIQVLATAEIVRSELNGALHFRPEASVNRAVVCAALVNLLDLAITVPQQPTFVDVPRTHWAYGVIETLADKNIVSGVDPGLFAPDRPMIREHLSFLIARVLERTNLVVAYDVFQRTGTPKDRAVLKRRDLSRIFYELLKAKLDIT